METPKVACSTVKQTLHSIETDRPGHRYADPERVHRRALSPLLSPETFAAVDVFTAPDFFRFCFVRDPFSRLLSAYLDKIAGNKPQKKNILRHLGHDEDAIDTAIDFATFVDVVCAQTAGEMDLHWRLQTVETMIEDVRYHAIGRAESFDADFRAILERIGVAPHDFLRTEDRHRTDAGDKLKAYYTPALERRVAERFAADFDRFGYAPTVGAPTLMREINL
ncbi:sulfotransferase family protein [Acuticoccus sp. M5D2P5]|nr:sulfotransferase family protein [Acuticoccus kalidii]